MFPADKKPPRLLLGEPNSFALKTFKERFPQILQGVEADPFHPSEVRAALKALGKEWEEDRVASLFPEGIPERFHPLEARTWRALKRETEGRSWSALPFFLAETLFYMKVLTKTGYFSPGTPGFGRDPFGPAKEAELIHPQGALAFAEELLQSTRNLPGPAQFMALLDAQLWGNRLDLSNKEMVRQAREEWSGGGAAGTSALLIDHRRPLTDLLFQAQRVSLVLDNAGIEAATDLAAAAVWLTLNPRLSVTIHAKAYPTFVSDATLADLGRIIESFTATPALKPWGDALLRFQAQGRLNLANHWFWNTPRELDRLPPELSEELNKCDLLLFKGDANYRRLFEDRRWPWEFSAREAAPRLGCPIGAIRMGKSELAVGLAPGQGEELTKKDPHWLFDGRWGVIQLIST